MCLLYTITLTCLLFSTTLANTLVKDKESIGFPEREENPSLVNTANRQPVYIPSMCPETELYYPGDQKDDWICDCRPAFLYHPKTDTCWPAYRQGPCQEGQYLVLTADSAIPVCEKNPCLSDSYVMYTGRCEQLASISPCRYMWPVPAALAVNATTLAINCEIINLDNRFGEKKSDLITTQVTCPPGCKRSINGKCVITL